MLLGFLLSLGFKVFTSAESLKSKHIISVIIFFLLGFSLAYLLINSNSPSKFERSKECATLQDEMRKQIDRIYYGKLDIIGGRITEVFYSQKLGSCLYVYENINSDVSEKLGSVYDYEIYDFFTMKKIFGRQCHSNLDDLSECVSEFENKLRSLKK